jgi:hypothetical protein
MFGSGWIRDGLGSEAATEMLQFRRRTEESERAAAAPLVERPRLLKHPESARTPVVLLTGPLGYGKSGDATAHGGSGASAR